MSAGKLIEYGVVVISTADGATSIYNDPTPINTLSCGGQMISGALSLVGPATALATAPAAATLTIGKITVDVQNGKGVNPGDIIALTGNAVAIIGAVGLVTVGTPVIIPALVLSTALGMLGVSLSQGWLNFEDDPNGKSNYVPGAVPAPVPVPPPNPSGCPTCPQAPYIPDGFNDKYNDGRSAIVRRDPLILDLDGDGLETVGADDADAVMFDHDGDGVKAKSGWIKPDDGLLVLDRNGNGTIDNGGELFGDSTRKQDGTLAKDGFDALADLDSNGDGVVDANDERFAELRVWRDLNSDGIRRPMNCRRWSRRALPLSMLLRRPIAKC